MLNWFFKRFFSKEKIDRWQFFVYLLQGAAAFVFFLAILWGLIFFAVFPQVNIDSVSPTLIHIALLLLNLYYFILVIKRLISLNRSFYFALLLSIPYVNIALILYLLLAKNEDTPADS